MISLQEQIEWLENLLGSVSYDYATSIIASLKRLQAIEGQGVVGALAKLTTTNRYVFTDETRLITTWISRGEVHEDSVTKVYTLPPDSQGMIDKLTAERDTFKAQFKASYADWLEVCKERDALLSECEKLRKQLNDLLRFEINVGEPSEAGECAKISDKYAVPEGKYITDEIRARNATQDSPQRGVAPINKPE